MLELTGILFFAFVIDLFIGDPIYRLHPVRIVGNGISIAEKVLRKFGLNGREGGVILVLVLETVSLSVYLAVSLALHRVYLPLGLCFDLYICYSLLALGDLFRHIKPVIRSLEAANLPEARKTVGMLLGRDTHYLDESGVSRGAVETLAENFVDGFLSPVFWYVAGGVLAFLLRLSPVIAALSFMLVFKIASTLDSMVGYKNPEYLYFGWAGARLDDLLNFIPARLSLGILFAGAWISGLHPLDGIRVALRDRKKHDSPNAGHAESFVAGALHIRLNGPIRYPDGLKNKPWLGDGSPDVGPMHIRRTIFLIKCSTWIAMVASISTLLLLV
jgi:adenosylcobinamide-phosphate synthase